MDTKILTDMEMKPLFAVGVPLREESDIAENHCALSVKLLQISPLYAGNGIRHRENSALLLTPEVIEYTKIILYSQEH